MLNLIRDAWIPVRLSSGGQAVVRPDQIADLDVAAFDWPRPDLNLACHELMIGLIYLACPPKSDRAWRRGPPDQVSFSAGLEPLSPAFDLLGDGPRFLQDHEVLEGVPNPTDMLFIDSAGGNTAKKNADLMVRRNRYGALDLPLAAMALYTLQAFAPAGGAGNRTSMRGGGPMVTLALPDAPGLMARLWENVPAGDALEDLTELPWMRPTVTSEKGRIVTPPEGDAPAPEAFFGQPRRLRLVEEGGQITGVIQRPYGANYNGWIHPLSPYYHIKDEKLPKHPKPGGFSYRNWAGVVLDAEGADRAGVILRSPARRMLVAGWAMKNATPVDFLWSEGPLFALDSEATERALKLVRAGEAASYALAQAVKTSLKEDDLTSGAGARARRQLYRDTQGTLEQILHAPQPTDPTTAQRWKTTLGRAVMAGFDREVMHGLADLSETRREAAVRARASLLRLFAGQKAFGVDVYGALDLERPAPPKKTKQQESA